MIPVEAVEAAAKILDFHLPDAAHESGCAMRCGYSGDELAEHLAAHVLEAAAPHMQVVELAAEYRRGYRDGLADRKQVAEEPRAWEPGDPIE